MLEIYRRMYEHAARGLATSSDQRVAARGATCFAIRLAREVVDYVYQAAGTNSIFENNRYERRFRDFHTLTQQSQAHTENFEALGQSLLGIKPVRKL